MASYHSAVAMKTTALLAASSVKEDLDQSRRKSSGTTSSIESIIHTRLRKRSRHRKSLCYTTELEAAAHPPATAVIKPSFKRIARLVKNQLTWTRSLTKSTEQNVRSYVVQNAEDGRSKHLSFNVDEFRPDSRCGFFGLTTMAKVLLLKPAWLRNPLELEYLEHITAHLKCFERYSMYLRKELAGHIYYEAHEKDRVIIRQGDKGIKMYFIVSGGVLIEKHEDHWTNHILHSTIVNELGPGAFFGELALLGEGRRKASIICREDSEFLTIDQSEFDKVLRKNHEVEWSTRLEIVCNHPFFTTWSETSLQKIAEGSSLVDYFANTVIIQDLSRSCDNDPVYVLVNGTCKVALQLDIVQNHRSKTLELADTAGKNTKTQWVIIRHLETGEMFGMGEGEPRVSVITSQRVQCLSISKVELSKLDRKGLARHREMAACQYPSRNEVFNRYVIKCQWDQYKKRLMKEVLSRVKPGYHAENIRRERAYR